MKTLKARKPVEQSVISEYDVRENVLTCRHHWDKSTQDQLYLLQADEHFDNAKCDRDLYKRHLDEAVKRNAYIIKFGDFFCAMQGKGDKRSSYSELRDAHKVAAYANAIVKESVEFHEPYASRMVMVGVGNHESGFTNKTGTDLTAMFVDQLRDKFGSPVVRGGYSGWIRFLFNVGQSRAGLKAWYTHGYGGGGPVTQDVIQGQRQMAYVHGANMMFSGHTHDAWCVERVAVSLSAEGRNRRESVVQCKIPTYKDEFGNGHGGWHTETGKPPKPLGGYWLRLSWRNDAPRFHLTRTEQ